LESSATEYLSMYVTGQKDGAVAGTLQSPVLAKAGEGTLRHFRASGELSGPLRTGDYSGVGSELLDGSVWAADEYPRALAPPPPGTRQSNWGTWIANFSISNDPERAQKKSVEREPGFTQGRAQGNVSRSAVQTEARPTNRQDGHSQSSRLSAPGKRVSALA